MILILLFTGEISKTVNTTVIAEKKKKTRTKSINYKIAKKQQQFLHIKIRLQEIFQLSKLIWKKPIDETLSMENDTINASISKTIIFKAPEDKR